MSNTDSTSMPLFKKSKRNRNIRKRPAQESLEEIVSEAGNNNNDSNDSNKSHNAKQLRGEGKGSTHDTVIKHLGGLSSKDRKAPISTDSAILDEAPKKDTVEYHLRKAADATRTIEIDSPTNPASNEKNVDAYTDAGTDKDKDESTKNQGLYKGMKGYSSRITTGGSKRAGPFKAPANVRSVSVFDYQPDVCKDYKETGYCGYGDSCKFLHDRGNYKSGWQLEKEFEEAQQQGGRRDNPNLWKVDSFDENDGADDTTKCKSSQEAKNSKLPFSCLICRKPFVKPVVTKCTHYFCESCALSHYRKTPKCYACSAATGGVFRRAKCIEAQEK